MSEVERLLWPVARGLLLALEAAEAARSGGWVEPQCADRGTRTEGGLAWLERCDAFCWDEQACMRRITAGTIDLSATSVW